MLKKAVMNKRGLTELQGSIIFILLVLIAFGILFVFVYTSSSGVLVYEQLYSKEIALAIDQASPGMIFYFNFEKGVELAQKNKVARKDIVILDNEQNVVKVKLSRKSSYAMKYFSDYDVSVEIGDETDYVVLSVQEKEVENEVA